jgi:hypothetical protein
MPIQTTYPFNYSAVQKGQAVENGAYRDSTGYSTAAIEFGVGLVYSGTSVDESFGLRLPTATTDVFIGVAKKILKQPRGLDNDFLSVVTSTTQVARYEIGDPITIRTLGQIWVYSEQAVAPTDPVFFRCVTNVALLAGDFRKDADTARAVQLSNARWVSKTSAAGLALLELY